MGRMRGSGEEGSIRKSLGDRDRGTRGRKHGGIRVRVLRRLGDWDSKDEGSGKRGRIRTGLMDRDRGTRGRKDEGIRG